MSELVFNPIFHNVSHTFKNQAFSAMYFGRHCGKNVIILKHDVTVMLAFGDPFQWSTPELIKAVSFRGDRRKGIQIVGSDNIILLLDEHWSLWRLVNAFEVPAGENECFHSLKEECFYEWVPFGKFNFIKVLAVTAMEHGFACFGVCRNFRRKLLVLSSIDPALEEYTFEELIATETDSFSYNLTSLKMENSDFENAFNSSEALLITDRFAGKTYLCAEKGKYSLINVSNNFLVSVLHFQQEKCLLLCFENGKLILCFYNKGYRQCVGYLSEKLVFVDHCCCSDSCLLWSDGLTLNHTKLIFNSSEDIIKLTHLKLNCCVQSPLSILKINQYVLVATINNIYYCITAGVGSGREIRKQPQELVSGICKGSSLTEELEKKTELLVHYFNCKDVVQKGHIKEKTDIRWEGNCLAIKTSLGISLREELWKIQLLSASLHKKSVHVVDLEADLTKEAFIVVENPFKSKCKVKVSLIGIFEEKDLFLDLGEVDTLESNSESDFSKQIKKILKKRNKFKINGT